MEYTIDCSLQHSGDNSLGVNEPMTYDLMVIAAHPDDAEVQMGGTLAKLAQTGQRTLIVDLCDGEPSDHAQPGVRREQALRAAQILGADRMFLDLQDRFMADNIPTRLTLAHLIRQHQPKMVFGTTGACIHPDHAAVNPLVTAAQAARAGRIQVAVQGR